MNGSNASAIKSAATINLLAGIWFFVSPWVYRAYGAPNAWNSWIVGALVALIAALRMSNPIGTRSLSVINFLLGAWVFASPWIYGYTGYSGRFANSLIVGAIIFITGVVGSSLHRPLTAPPLHP